MAISFLEKAEDRFTELHPDYGKSAISKYGNRTLVFFDTETTGVDEEAEVICMAALGIGKENFLVKEYYSPRGKLNPEAMKVNFITYEMLDGKPYAPDGKGKKIFDRLNNQETVLIAHNIKFDIRLMEQSRIIGPKDERKYKFIDTMICAKELLQNSTSFSLTGLCFEHSIYKNAKKLGMKMKNLYGLDMSNMSFHDALSDTFMLSLLFDRLFLEAGGDLNKLIEITEKGLRPADKNNTKLPFGKHKGKTVNEIIKLPNKEGENYIRWCLENMNNLDKEWRSVFESAVSGTNNKQNAALEIPSTLTEDDVPPMNKKTPSA